MSNLKFHIDIDRLAKQFDTLKESVKTDLTKGVENLANMTHARVLELAGEELTSLQKLYKDNVEFSNPSEGFWIVTLKEPALWIEDGRKAGFMEELLNGKSSRMGKNGKYAIIPFKHNKNPSDQSTKTHDLAQEIKYALQKKGINWKKLEMNEDGSPRLGLLHRFDLETARPLAAKESHKHSLTKGVAVYQRKDAEGNTKRDVMTFRVISEKSRNEGAWVHPGRQGNKLMDKAMSWAISAWERDILPAIFAKYNSKD